MDKRRVDRVSGVGPGRRRAGRASLRAACARTLLLLLAALSLACLLPLTQQAVRAEDDWDAPRPADKAHKDKPAATDKASDGGKQSDRDKDSKAKDDKDKDSGGKDGKGNEGETAGSADNAPPAGPADPPADGDQAGNAEPPGENEDQDASGRAQAGTPGTDMFLDITSSDNAADADGTADSDEAGSAPVATDSNGDAAPPLQRRPRPQTAEQERSWKLSKTREDPFLNPPGGELGQGLAPGAALYRPSDWLSHELPQDYSVYLAQDSKGKLQGTLSLSIQTRKGEKGEDLVVLSRGVDFGQPSRTEVLSSLDGLSPRLVLREALVAAGAAGPDFQSEGDALDAGPLPVPNLRVDYLYDRVTIVWDDGDVATHERMRALPHSFDVQQLPLIMRLLNYNAKQWPFEAYITLPEEHSSAPLVIQGAQLQNQLSAEGEKVPCYHVEALIGKQQWQWWVQKGEPHRLIRFSDGVLTYTLSEYSQSSRGGY